ncbi:IS66 family transposase [Bradyrhizobium diazoefficiens]
MGHVERFQTTFFLLSRTYPDASWSHSRRKIIAATPKAGSPIAEAVLARIAALYAIEKEIRGADAPARQTTRNPAGHFKFLRVWSVKFLHPRGRTRDC